MLIKVKVFPKEKNTGVLEKAKDSFEIKVKAKPERGEANKESIKILANYFKISESKIRLIKGAKQRNKIFNIG